MTLAQYPTNNISGSPFGFFSATSHGTIYEEPWEYVDTEEVFYGVQGSHVTLDKVHARWLRLDLDLFGYETEDLLRGDLNTLNSYINELLGPLTVTGFDAVMTYNDVIFKGFSQGRKIQYYGGTSPGWGALDLLLSWRQLSP